MPFFWYFQLCPSLPPCVEYLKKPQSLTLTVIFFHLCPSCFLGAYLILWLHVVWPSFTPVLISCFNRSNMQKQNIIQIAVKLKSYGINFSTDNIGNEREEEIPSQHYALSSYLNKKPVVDIVFILSSTPPTTFHPLLPARASPPHLCLFHCLEVSHSYCDCTILCSGGGLARIRVRRKFPCWFQANS